MRHRDFHSKFYRIREHAQVRPIRSGPDLEVDLDPNFAAQPEAEPYRSVLLVDPVAVVELEAGQQDHPRRMRPRECLLKKCLSESDSGLECYNVQE